MKRLAILGSTGSIGTSTLSVVESFPERFKVTALAAGTSIRLLGEQITRHRPSVVSVAGADSARELQREHPGCRVVHGPAGLIEVACHAEADMVVAALVGSIGLQPVMEAIRAGKHIALANKETMVVAGDLVMTAAARHGVSIVPVDSEHNALHQALRVGPEGAVKRLVLTASGGPFRGFSRQQLASVTVEQALDHPTWKMGAKISIDSATLMNKGLEIIEAHHLFSMPVERIDVLVHPESLVHSLVEYIDGTLIAQLSINDMRFPILYALAWPERLASPMPGLDLAAVGRLSFERPDEESFPALGLAREALRCGGEIPAVLNAANEVSVSAFLDRRIGLGGIPECVSTVMESWMSRNHALESIEQALAVDREARMMAEEHLRKFEPRGCGSDG